MKKLTKILIILIIGIFVLANMSSVYALSFRFNVSATKTEVKPGEQTEISMEISEIAVGELGINAVEAVLEYDDNVFEIVTRSDIKAKNNWTITYNQEAGSKNGNFLASNIISGVKEKQVVGTIVFQVKEGVQPQTTTIKFKDIKSNNGQELIPEEDRSIDIKIIEDNGSDITVTPSPSPRPTQSPRPNNNGSNSNNGTSNGNNYANDTKLPQTGIQEVAVVSFIIATLIGIISYIKYKRLKIK